MPLYSCGWGIGQSSTLPAVVPRRRETVEEKACGLEADHPHRALTSVDTVQDDPGWAEQAEAFEQGAVFLSIAGHVVSTR